MRVLALAVVTAWILIAVTLIGVGIYKLADSDSDNNTGGGVFLTCGVILLIVVSGWFSNDRKPATKTFSVTMDVKDVKIADFCDEWKKIEVTGKDGECFKAIIQDGIAGLVVPGKKYVFFYRKSDDDEIELIDLEECEIA